MMRAFGTMVGSLASWGASLALLVAGCSGCEPGAGKPATTATSQGMVAPSGSPDAPSASPSNGPQGPDYASHGPRTDHPRLWVRAEDLPRLRGWVNGGNAIYTQGLAPLVGIAERDMDEGKVPGTSKDCRIGVSFCESYMVVFAFMALVHPDKPKRDAYAERAKKILMHLVDRANSGDANDPIASPTFSLRDRSRWVGDAFPLTVDWIYPALSAAEKEKIRRVFLRWSEEQLHATTTSHNHPKPVGVLNDPVLVKDRTARRYAANNYFANHARNLVLMSLALDPADDPEQANAQGQYKNVRGYLANAIGAWLYMSDHVLRNDGRGGAAPEGFEYGHSTLGALAQLYLALYTAGEDDPKRWGTQVRMESNPFWSHVVPAYLHSLSPAPAPGPNHGTSLQAAWWGDGESYEIPDFIGLMGPLGIRAAMIGNDAQAAATRWIQVHAAPGAQAELGRRASAYNGGISFRHAILYFLLMDPSKNAADPRPSLPLAHVGEGLGQIFARTAWSADASWFQFQIGWALIDHQHGDGNNFGFYRKGEWLTKERSGYGFFFGGSDQHNTLAVENDKPAKTGGDRDVLSKGGSQWALRHDDDGKLIAHSEKDTYVYALGDGTGLYNSAREGLADIKHVSRSILWIKPDRIVVYDRATTGKDNRFKRFWLQTPAVAAVAGNGAVVTTKAGQKLYVTSLLPADAKLTAQPYQGGSSWETKLNPGEPMIASLVVEPAHAVKDVRFLHVLEGTDATAAKTPAIAINVSAPAQFAGAAVGQDAVLFPLNVPAASEEVAYSTPSTVKRHFVTGLTPGAGYDVATKPSSGAVQVTVRKGSAHKADSGGVLVF